MSRSRDLADAGRRGSILKDVTADASELNKLDGVTADTAELNKLDGVSSTSTELNYVDVTLGTVTASKAVTADSNTDIALGASGKLKLGSSGGIYESDGSTAVLTESSGAVTLENVALGSTVTGGIPSGMVAPFGMSSVPTGWLACDGSNVSRSTYATLFSAIGTTWGAGDGSSTFTVPDLRGAFLRGTGTAGVSGDYVGPNVGAYQDDQNAEHNHSASSSSSGSSNSTGSHQHKAAGNTPNWGSHWANAGAFNGYITTNHQYTASAGSHSHSISVSTSTSIGNSGSTEARVYNRGVQYCIKF